MLKKYLKLGVIIMATGSLVNCNLNNLVGIPKVSIERNFGSGAIAEILEKKEVWTGGDVIYTNDSKSRRNKKTDDDIYRMLINTISNNKKNTNIEDYLNNVNLGVNCENNLCKYHGYYIKYLENGPDHYSNGKRLDRYDIYISFKPKDIENSYTALIVSKRIL